MPRRRRVSKRRRELSLSEILDEVLPPNPLVRRGLDEPGGTLDDADDDEFVDFDDRSEDLHHGAT